MELKCNMAFRWFVGLDIDSEETSRLLEDRDLYLKMSRCPNPHGDGRAAARVIAAIKHYFRLGKNPPDWRPASRQHPLPFPCLFQYKMGLEFGK